MNLRPVSNPHPYIACVLAAGMVKSRMAWAELSDPERIEARQIAVSQRCTIGDAADIVRRSRR